MSKRSSSSDKQKTNKRSKKNESKAATTDQLVVNITDDMPEIKDNRFLNQIMSSTIIERSIKMNTFELMLSFTQSILQKSFHYEKTGLNVACVQVKKGAIVSYGYNNWVSGLSQESFQFKGIKKVSKEVKKKMSLVDNVVYRQKIDDDYTKVPGFGSEYNYLILKLNPYVADDQVYDSREHMKLHAEMNSVLYNTENKMNVLLVNVIPCTNCSKFLMGKASKTFGIVYLFDFGKYPETWASKMVTDSFFIQAQLLSRRNFNEDWMKEMMMLTKRTQTPLSLNIIQKEIVENVKSKIDIIFDGVKSDSEAAKVLLGKKLSLSGKTKYVCSVKDYLESIALRSYKEIYTYTGKLQEYVLAHEFGIKDSAFDE